jgi:zinc transporter ZupT
LFSFSLSSLFPSAAFLDSGAVGTATAIAIGFHEIPHEISNYAILVKNGLSPKRVLAYNLLSALASLVGILITIGIGYATDATYYILPFATGNFIYIASADLVPELHKDNRGFGRVISHTSLMGVGFGLMYCVSVVEKFVLFFFFLFSRCFYL